MRIDEPLTTDPWRLDLIAVRDSAYSSTERRSLSREVESGALVRLRRGAYVERAAFAAMTLEDQHIVRMRALAATSDRPPVFSHWSAAVLHGLPVLDPRLARIHTTVGERRERGQEEVSAHLFAVHESETTTVRSLRATTTSRTVVDVAGGSAFPEGVSAADAALRLGIDRAALEAAAELVGFRRASSRIDDVIAFAHPGAESMNESRSRTSMLRLGIEPPVLQYEIVVEGRSYFLDFFFPGVGAGGEADGALKYLDPLLGASALLAEKRREDLVRAELTGLARWGWIQSGSPNLLRPVLARAGVVPARPPATLEDYAAAARHARPRREVRPAQATLSG